MSETQTIVVPGLDEPLIFPATMQENDIADAIKRNFPELHKPPEEFPGGEKPERPKIPDATPMEQPTIGGLDREKISRIDPETKQTLSKAFRAIAEGGGLIGGGVAGTVAEPGAGTVVGAGLGYSGGSQLADRWDEILGLKGQETLLEAGTEAVKDVGSGMAMEMGGQLTGKAISCSLFLTSS